MPKLDARPPERRHEPLRLKYPFMGSELHEILFVLTPRAGELRLMPMPSSAGEDKDGKPLPAVKQYLGDLHPFAAKICGLTQAEFDKLELEDYTAVMEAVGKVVEAVPLTGVSASPGSPGSSTSGETNS